MGAREAVAQYHLRHTKAIDHRDRDLIAALAAVGERGAGEIERELGAQHLQRHQRILRPRRRREQQRRELAQSSPIVRASHCTDAARSRYAIQSSLA